MLNPFPAPGPVRQADPSGGPVLARSTTILQCPAILSGSLSGLQLPSFSTNLVSTAAVQDAMVTTTTTGGQRVAICTCIRTGRHLATFTRRPGSSLYSLTTEPAQVASSGQVSASGQVAAPCSCRLLSHQNLLWHHRLGHPSQPRLCGMHSRLLVSGLPRSLPPLPPYLPCVKGRQRAAPHSSFPTTTAPLQNLHMDSVSSSANGSVRTFLSCVCTLTEVYVVHQLNLWPRISLTEISTTLRWTGRVGDASLFRFYHPTSRRVLLSQDVTFDESVPFYHLFPYHTAPLPPPPLFLAPGPHPVDPLPLAERVEVTVESGPAGGGAARGTASGGFKLAGAEPGGGEPECAEPESAEPGGSESEGAEPGGAEPESAEPGGAESEGAESGGAEPRGTASAGGARGPADGGTGAGGAGATSHGVAGGTRGAGGAGPGGARTRGTGAAGAGGVGGTGARDPGAGDPSAGGAGGGGTSAGGTSAGGAGAGGTGAGDRGAGDAGAGGARAGDPGAGGTGARDPGAGGAGARGAGAGGAGAGGTGAGGVGAGGAGAGGAGAGGAGAGSIGAGGTGAGDFGAGGAGARGAGASGTGAGGFVQQQPYFIPRLPSSLLPPSSVLRQTDSPLSSPSPYADQTDSLTERREPDSHPALPVRAICTGRHVPHPRPPPVPGTHIMTLRPSSFPLRVPLPSLLASSLAYSPDPESDLVRAASPSVTRLLATVVTDHSFESAAAYALVAEVVDIAAACRLDYATSLVAESESDCPPFVRGECALGTDVLEDRWEEFECLAAAVPHLVAMLLAPEGDPNAPDIPTPRSYVEAITGPYSSQWQTAMDVEMASWKSTGTYVDALPPPGANITFSPTPKMTTLRVLLHVAAQHDYELHSLDFSTAFLQGSLHEEIWLRCPPGFIGSFPSGTQWSLQRPVYGLCQAPREWHDTLRSTLVALGFAPSTADPSLFKRTDTSLPPFYIIVYVDDSVTHGAAGPSALRLPVLLATVHSSAYLSLALSFTFRRVRRAEWPISGACGLPHVSDDMHST
ncbi:unnamed protein product [Closterium sp. NIES-54]